MSPTLTAPQPAFRGSLPRAFPGALPAASPAPSPQSAARPAVRPSAGTAPADRPRGPVTHAPYRREPYVRARPVPGLSVDGKAVAWTRTEVLLHWIDDDGRAHNRWLAASLVRRIQRSESAWQDPYDDHAFHLSALHSAAQGRSPLTPRRPSPLM